jgi:hypothetical protein
MKMAPAKWSVTAFAIFLGVMLAEQMAQSQQARDGKTIVLKGATIIDGMGKAPVSDGVIVIESDRIKAAGGKGTSIPAEAQVIDLTGKFVIPGLVDDHVHFVPWLSEMFLNYGVTSIMVPGNPDYTKEQREASLKADARTPRIFSTGGRLPVNPSMSREEVRSAIKDWVTTKKPDYAASLTYNKTNAQVYQWAAEDIHDAGLVFFGHTEDAPASVRAGQDVVEHIWGFAEALMSTQEMEDFQKGKYVHWGLFLNDRVRVDQLIKEAVGTGAYLNPTLVFELGSQTPLAPEHEMLVYDLFRDPALTAYVPDSLAKGAMFKLRSVRNYSSKYEIQAPYSALTPEDKEKFFQAYRLCSEFLKKWVQAGGKIMGGTDDPSSGTAGLTIHMEMRMLVEAGLTPMQALQTATGWGAELLTARKQVPTTPPVGVIAPGAYADLVVLSTNPLDSISNTRKIEQVMKGGQFVKLGYTRSFAAPKPTEPYNSIHAHTPAPEISAITPHFVVEGTPDFEVTLDGAGFVSNSVVRVDGNPVPTTFVNIRALRAQIPAAVVRRASPTGFTASGPAQAVGVSGDRTVKIAVFNGPPDGGLSDSISLKIVAKWVADELK